MDTVENGPITYPGPKSLSSHVATGLDHEFLHALPCQGILNTTGDRNCDWIVMWLFGGLILLPLIEAALRFPASKSDPLETQWKMGSTVRAF